MRRLWFIAILACGSLVFNGCGGDKKTQTADNSSSESDSSSSSARPSRTQSSGSNSSSGKSNQSSGSSQSSGQQMSGDPERRGSQQGSSSDQQMQDQMAKMKKQQQQQSGGGSNISKPAGMSQKAWDSMAPEAKQRFANMGGSGGGSPTSGGNRGGQNSGQGSGQGSGGQMSGDPRMRNGQFNSDDNSSSGGQQMSGDPRMQNGQNSQNSSADQQMQGDPRMQDPRQGGNSGGASSASAPGGAGASSAPGGGSGFDSRNFNGGGRNQQAKAAPVTLKDKSIKAFQDGDDDGGFQFMYGHWIAEDEGRERISLQLLPTIKRPRTSIRWGVGVVFKQNKGFSGDPPKIGEQPNVLPQGRNSGRNQRGGVGGRGGFNGSGAPGAAGGSGGMQSGGGFGGGRGGGNPANGGMEELVYYTGEVGETLVEMLDKLRTRGTFGRMIAKVSAGEAGGGNRRGGSRNAGTFSSGSGGGATIDDGRTAADRNRFRGGGGGGGGFNPNRQNQPKASAASSYKNVLPGVLMLGKSSLKGLQERARAHGIDILVICEVNCKLVPSNGQKINDTKLSLYDVSKKQAERVGRPSTTLNNIRVWMARQKNQDEDKDPVQNAVKAIFESGKEDGFLATYKIAAMPDLNQGQVMNRLSSLITESQASGNPMPGLVELTYYREKGLLPEKPYIDAVNKVAGSDIGEVLANGAEAERVKAINALLPPEWRVQEAAGGDDDDIL